MYKKHLRVILILLFSLQTTLIYSQTLYYYSNSFKSFLESEDAVIFHQHILGNYLWHPGINEINSSQSDKTTKDLDFDLNVEHTANFYNFSFGLNPAISFNNFRFEIKQDYNLFRYNFVDYYKNLRNINDMLVTASYNLKKGNFNNNISASVSIPFGKAYIYDQWGYIWYYPEIRANGSRSVDFIYSDKFCFNFDRFGFYGNLFFRQSLTNKQIFIAKNWDDEILQTEEYIFKHGLFSALTLGGYTGILRNLHIHYGLGFAVNGNNYYKLITTYPDGEIYEEIDRYSNQQFTFSDFRLGLSTRIKTIDISLFLFNPTNRYYSSTTNIYRKGLNYQFKISWYVF